MLLEDHLVFNRGHLGLLTVTLNLCISMLKHKCCHLFWATLTTHYGNVRLWLLPLPLIPVGSRTLRNRNEPDYLRTLVCGWWIINCTELLLSGNYQYGDNLHILSC